MTTKFRAGAIALAALALGGCANKTDLAGTPQGALYAHMGCGDLVSAHQTLGSASEAASFADLSGEQRAVSRAFSYNQCYMHAQL